MEAEVIDLSEAIAISAIVKKLDDIVIPNLEFADTPFDDCVAYLWAVSIELDHNEVIPEEKGVRIVSNAQENAENSITIRLVNIPLKNALRYVATLGQTEMRLEPDGVVLVPIAGPVDMLTQVYQFSFDFVEASGEKNARMTLEKAGIEFKAGTDVVFNSENFQLMVRNSENEHAKVRAFLIATEAEED
ncbi:hypothetical protein VSU19_01400 [Verrucomicrobiales bacterium BCK34]|nr:hypothetical protein [Verrucomicrobiales bacterium BCK34]